MQYKDIATKQNVSLSAYLSLYSPPVDWILECLAENSEDKQLITVLKQVQQHANRYAIFWYKFNCKPLLKYLATNNGNFQLKCSDESIQNFSVMFTLQICPAIFTLGPTIFSNVFSFMIGTCLDIMIPFLYFLMVQGVWITMHELHSYT